MRQTQDPLSAIRWLPIYNGDTAPIPPYGVMRSNGFDTENGRYIVGQPDGDSLTEVFINGPIAIPPLTESQAHRADPCTALIESSDGAPAIGDDYGTESGSWKLHAGKTGFRVIAPLDDTSVAEMTFFGAAFKDLTDTDTDLQAQIDLIGGSTLAARGTTGLIDHGETTGTTDGVQQLKGVKAFIDGLIVGPQVAAGAEVANRGGTISFMPEISPSSPGATYGSPLLTRISDIYIAGQGAPGDGAGNDQSNYVEVVATSEDPSSNTWESKISLYSQSHQTAGGSPSAQLRLDAFSDGGSADSITTIVMIPGSITLSATTISSGVGGSILIGQAITTFSMDGAAFKDASGSSQGSGASGTFDGATYYCGWRVTAADGITGISGGTW